MSRIKITIAAVSVISLIALFFAGAATSTDLKNTQAREYNISYTSIDVLAKYFGKEIIEKTMNQPGCKSIRIHYSKQADGTNALVISGVDSNGKELITSTIPKCPSNLGCPQVV
jgi:hypothetical protein